jgi:hypothetical protein
MRYVKRLYGHTPARDFGPLALKAVRKERVHHPITRTVKVKDPKTGEEKEAVKLLCQGLETGRRRNGKCRSAFHRLALPADGPAVLDLLDVLRGVGDFARRARHVHRYPADLRPGLEGMVR